MIPKRPRLLQLVTHPMTARLLLRGQLEWMQQRGFDVTLVTSGHASARGEAPFRHVTVPMAREISPLGDLVSLARLCRLFRRLRPTLVNCSTPKAGLLGSQAAWLTRTPVRVYLLRGLRLETTSGLRRRLLLAAERRACRSVHRVLSVSESLRQRALELELCEPERIRVLAGGSSNGVDLGRFSEEASPELRARLGIAEHAPVVGFVGRLTRDKGLDDLRSAFERLAGALPDARLLLVGAFEPGDPVSAETKAWLEESAAVVRTGEVEETAPYYPLMHVLAFPSHREGLPNVPLEAAASAVPTVGYRVTGTVDAIVDGTTGSLVPPGDSAALAEALVRYLEMPMLSREHGAAARRHVAAVFPPERVWRALEDEYRELLEAV